MAKQRTWYGDKRNRRCEDCGERTDWDERLRLGLVPVGGPTQPDGYTPVHDGTYGNTPAGQTEQAKLNAHCKRYHEGGTVLTETASGWTLEIRRYATGTAFARDMLKARRPFYAIVTGITPNGEPVRRILEGFPTVEACRFAAFPNVVHFERLQASLAQA